MLFILFCLIMRTGYQGKQFEFMLKEMRRPQVQTIDELIQNEYLIWLSYDDMEAVKDMEFVERWFRQFVNLIENLIGCLGLS